MRTTLLLGSALAVALGAGLAEPATAVQTTLTVGMASADVGRLDPHLTATTPDKGLLNWMFNGLVRIRPGQASPNSSSPTWPRAGKRRTTTLQWTFKHPSGRPVPPRLGSSPPRTWPIRSPGGDKDTSSFAADFAAFKPPRRSINIRSRSR